MRRPVAVVAVLLVTLCVRHDNAQQKPSPPAPAATGTISGVLTGADLGQPMRKAQVRLLTPGSRRSSLSRPDRRRPSTSRSDEVASFCRGQRAHFPRVVAGVFVP
jgi:hypothetical protein